MLPTQDRELWLLRLAHLRPAPLARARRWQAGHQFDRGESIERRRLPNWRHSFGGMPAEPCRSEGPPEPSELRERQPEPAECGVPRVILKGSLGRDRAIHYVASRGRLSPAVMTQAQIPTCRERRPPVPQFEITSRDHRQWHSA